MLQVDLRTGRTHQIRVHCQAMGHPIVADPVYGQRGALAQLARSNSALHRVLNKARRQMLHAGRLGFSHPVTGRSLAFEAPLPEDMAAILEELFNMPSNVV